MTLLQKELKWIKKEKLRCKKLYPDWEDNDFNCGPLKFIWAESTTINPSFSTLNDLIIYYNRDTEHYLLDIDITKEFHSAEQRVLYLEACLTAFKNYLIKENKFELKFNPYNFDCYHRGELFEGMTLTELYYKFKIFVKGYKQL